MTREDYIQHVESIESDLNEFEALAASLGMSGQSLTDRLTDHVERSSFELFLKMQEEHEREREKAVARKALSADGNVIHGNFGPFNLPGSLQFASMADPSKGLGSAPPSKPFVCLEFPKNIGPF